MGRTHRKSQSAMEYLMTYGWAILIMAIVLVALFELGIFNSANFAPRTTPGACQIFRPQGPGSTFNINLEGECNGELPEYVAQIGYPANSYLTVPDNSNLDFNGVPFSISLWFMSSDPTGAYESIAMANKGYAGGCTANYALFLANNPVNLDFETTSSPLGCSSLHQLIGGLVVANTWYNVVGTYNGIAMVLYEDGVYEGSLGISATPPQSTTQPLYFGRGYAANYYFTGSLANIQIYNTSLSANDVETLYTEGIGGAPIDITSLAGWWPLNGNANDYSGNQNNGVPTNIVYTTSWASTYTPP